MVRVGNSEVHISNETNCSKIVTNYTFTATKLFQDSANLFQHNPQSSNNLHITSPTQPLSVDNGCSTSNELSSPLLLDNNDYNTNQQQLIILEKPFQFVANGKFIIYTDENKQISRMEIETQDCTMKPI
jgi:hypothetical protein